jgi:hypothetical protein
MLKKDLKMIQPGVPRVGMLVSNNLAVEVAVLEATVVGRNAKCSLQFARAVE